MSFKLLFYVSLLVVLFRCLHGETRVKVKVMLKEYHVNGRDWDDKKCDIIYKTACDPIFLLCIDKSTGNDDPNSCAYVQKGWSTEYDDRNDIHFGNKIGNNVDNPIETTVTDWAGSFKFKVNVKDHDDVNNHDRIDEFSYTYHGDPARGSATATWDHVGDIYGRRPKNKSRLKLEVLLYCEADWYDADCSVFCVAHDDNTHGHYTCDSVTGHKVCRSGWETPEENCLVRTNDCEENYCVNGATCVDGDRKYSCDCMEGFTGELCETDINECASDPCLNGGRCLDQIAYFHCVCTDPYTGDRCQHHVCTVQGYCENGGTCYDDGLGNVSCICTHPYIGRHCDVDRCDVLVCENGGSCVNGSCVCPPDYLGNLCEFLFCDQVTCDNGGSCIGDTCVCPPGYSGRYCHIYLDYCESDPCQNEGTCRRYPDGYTCRCLPGYNGTLCENEVSPGWVDEEKALGLVETATGGGAASWLVGLIVAVIAFIILLVVGAACFIRRRTRQKKASDHSPPVVSSQSGDQSSFPNPLYNTDLATDLPPQGGAVMGSIPTTAEKVGFPDLEATLSPPPPYTLHEAGKLKDPEYAVVGPANPPRYTDVGLSPAALPGYHQGATGGGGNLYDNPRKLMDGSSPHYDNPNELRRQANNNDPHYAVPKSLKKNVKEVKKGLSGNKVTEHDYTSISEMRSTESAMDDSIHNNSTNEMLARDNAGFEEE